jgi:hypothetical protein
MPCRREPHPRRAAMAQGLMAWEPFREPLAKLARAHAGTHRHKTAGTRTSGDNERPVQHASVTSRRSSIAAATSHAGERRSAGQPSGPAALTNRRIPPSWPPNSCCSSAASSGPCELFGADDLEVLADEDVVRPVNADVVDVVLAVAQLHDTVHDAAWVGSERGFGRPVGCRSADDRA